MSENLMLRLQSFQFDPPGVALTFTTRLARENGWSPEFTVRVVAEYKRFLYLAVCAGHPVTPSREVDEVWHLHLCYTRSYWDELCGKVLGKPLHHGPTEGGAKEEAKFGDWYAKTLMSYRQIFREEPPADIWPPASARFRSRPASDADHWKVPKRPLKRAGLALGGLTGMSLLAGCSDDPAFTASTVFGGIVFFSIVMVIVTLMRYARSNHGGRKHKGSHRRGRDGGCGGGGFVSCGSSDSSHDSGDSGGSSGCGGGGCGGGGD